MDDVTVLYQGGSGGFLLYYYLLLSNRYQTGLEYNNVNELIQQQFPPTIADNPSLWKHNEFWPDNEKCLASPGHPKLFLICNPCWDNAVTPKNKEITASTKRYLLYTDMHTQLRMAYEKSAYWFTETSKKKFNAPAATKQYIREILKSNVNNLDPMITKVVAQFRPHYMVKLQDFLTTKTLPGLDAPTQAQIDFVDYWTSIQPTKVKRLL